MLLLPSPSKYCIRKLPHKRCLLAQLAGILSDLRLRYCHPPRPITHLGAARSEWELDFCHKGNFVMNACSLEFCLCHWFVFLLFLLLCFCTKKKLEFFGNVYSCRYSVWQFDAMSVPSLQFLKKSPPQFLITRVSILPWSSSEDSPMGLFISKLSWLSSV